MSLPERESLLWMRLLVLSESMDDPECSAEHVIAFLRGLEEGMHHLLACAGEERARAPW